MHPWYSIIQFINSRIILLLLYVSCCVNSVFSQRTFPAERILLPNGLDHSAITTLFRDRTGFLWIGTGEGLIRFDGAQYEIFQHDESDPHSIIGNRICGIAEDAKGYIWVSAYNGVCRLDPVTRWFETIPISLVQQDPFENYSLHALYIDRSDRVWVSVSQGLVSIYPRNLAMQLYAFPTGTQGKHVFQITEDANGGIQVAGEMGFYSVDTDSMCLNPERMVTEGDSPIESGGLRFVYNDVHQDRRYFCYWGKGLLAGSLTGNRLAQVFDNTTCWSMIDHAGGKLVAGTFEGFRFVSEDNDAVFPMPIVNRTTGLTEPVVVNTILKDAEGIVWVGSNAGLFKQLPVSGFENIALSQFSAIGDFHDVNSIVQDPTDHSIWLGFWGIGVIHYMPESGDADFYHAQSTDIALRLPDKWANQLFVYGRDLYLTTDGHGLLRFDRTLKRFVDACPNIDATKLIHGKTNRLTMNTSGEIVGLSARGGFYLYHPVTGSYQQFEAGVDAPTSIKPRFLSAIAEDTNHNYWIATGQTGIMQFDIRDNRFQAIKKDASGKPFFPYEFQDLTIDHAGNIWIASSEGLVMLDKNGNIVRVFTSADGLPGNYIVGLLGDNANRMWVATDYGLAVCEPGEQLFKAYTAQNGLFSDRVSGVYRFNDTLIAATCFGGVSIFDPDNIETPSANIRVVLTGLRIINNETPWTKGQPFIVPPGAATVSFDFTVIDHFQPGRHEYAYLLDGDRSEWTNIGAVNELTFANLKPGTYTLFIKVKNITGQWSDELLEVPFIVEPPFYQTWWFRLAAGACIILIVFALLQWRIRNVQKEARRKGEIELQLLELELKALRAQMNPHFIFNSLNSIQAYILHEDKFKASAYLQKFSRLIRMILDTSHRTAHSLQEEVEILTLYLELEQMRLKKGFTFSVSIDQKLSMQTIDFPAMVIQPLAENAVWHGFTGIHYVGTLAIEFQQRGEDLLCIVEDNGIGLKLAGIKKAGVPIKHRSIGVQLVDDRLRAWCTSTGLTYAFTLHERTMPATGTRAEIVIFKYLQNESDHR